MLDFTQPLRLMPPSGTEVAAQERATAATSSTSGNLIHVPMECATYDTEGICLTGPMQLKWVEQLLERPRQFVLHVDGKHKLHHGGWVLMTVGTHYLYYDTHNEKLATSFLPLLSTSCASR